MPTLNLTDNEYNLVRRAVGNLNDFHNDTLFERIESIDIFSSTPVMVAPSDFAKLRNELGDLMEEYVALRVLLSKLNIQTNEEGYSL